MKPIVPILLSCLLTLSGCASFDFDASSTGVADISQIAPRADGGPKVSVSYSTTDFRINFGSAPNIGGNFVRALEGSGLFSEVESGGNNEDKLHINLVAGSNYDPGVLGVMGAVLSIITVYVIPQTVDSELNSAIQIWQNGELLDTIEMTHSVSVIDSSLPLAYLFGSTGSDAGSAYAALLASHTIEKLHQLNIL